MSSRVPTIERTLLHTETFTSNETVQPCLSSGRHRRGAGAPITDENEECPEVSGTRGQQLSSRVRASDACRVEAPESNRVESSGNTNCLLSLNKQAGRERRG